MSEVTFQQFSILPFIGYSPMWGPMQAFVPPYSIVPR